MATGYHATTRSLIMRQLVGLSIPAGLTGPLAPGLKVCEDAPRFVCRGSVILNKISLVASRPRLTGYVDARKVAFERYVDRRRDGAARSTDRSQCWSGKSYRGGIRSAQKRSHFSGAANRLGVSSTTKSGPISRTLLLKWPKSHRT